jgi:hypothetical protein
MDSQKTMLNVEIRKILESEDDNGEKTIQLRKLFFKTIHQNHSVQNVTTKCFLLRKDINV